MTWYDNSLISVLTILSIEFGFGVSPYLIVAAVHDRAPINDVAMRAIQVVSNDLLDVGRFSHTTWITMGGGMNEPTILFVVEDPKWVSDPLLHLYSTPEDSIWGYPQYTKHLQWCEKILWKDDLLPATSTKLQQVVYDPAKTRKLNCYYYSWCSGTMLKSHTS